MTLPESGYAVNPEASPVTDGERLVPPGSAPKPGAAPTPLPVSPAPPARWLPLDRERLARAKSAYTTRRVNLAEATLLATDGVEPRAGDLVLARVVGLGQHGRLELPTGRRARLHPGDEIVVTFGNRYAPDQFEAYVPPALGPCELVAAGGVAGRVASRSRAVKKATRIEALGLLARSDRSVLNLADYRLRPGLAPPPRPGRRGAGRPGRAPVYCVLGAAMNAGKTTTAAGLVRGLTRGGLEVAAGKATGTGAGGDRWSMVDAGAGFVLDFTDLGQVSTFGLEPPAVESLFEELLDALEGAHPDAVLVEVADGLCHEETMALIRSRAFRERVQGIFFAAGDALGAAAGVDRLRALGLPLLGVSGSLTCSPLAMREAAAVTALPVLALEDLTAPEILAARVPAMAASLPALRDGAMEPEGMESGLPEPVRPGAGSRQTGTPSTVRERRHVLALA